MPIAISSMTLKDGTRGSRFCGYEDSVGIPTGFSVGMGWVWGIKI